MQFLLLKAVERETPPPPPRGLYKLLLFLPFKAKKGTTPTPPKAPQSQINKDTLIDAPARQLASADTLLVDVFALPPASTDTLLDDLLLLPSTPTNRTNTSVPSSPSSSVVEQ